MVLRWVTLCPLIYAPSPHRMHHASRASPHLLDFFFLISLKNYSLLFKLKNPLRPWELG